jgi:hypothetical protein
MEVTIFFFKVSLLFWLLPLLSHVHLLVNLKAIYFSVVLYL